MTVSTEVDHNEYTGNGATTSFPYTFRIFKKSDLVVQVSDLNGNVTELVLDTGYTVTGAGTYSGGSVVLPSPLAAGWRITIDRVLDVVQETDLRNQGKFFPEVHEDAFDYLTMLIQQCFGWFRRALMKPSLLAKYYDAKQNRISNLADPSLEQDAVNNRSMRNYVDAAIAGVVGGFGWFIQYGSGAVYRTFQDKMRDTVSARDFGAKGDGITDDTDALQAAINTLNVNIPPGTYLFSTLAIPDGCVINGSGYTQTTLKQISGTNATAITATANNFTLTNLGIDGNYFTSAWNAATGVLGNTSGNGLEVQGFGFTIDILLNNVPGIGAWFKDPGAENSASRIALYDISIVGRDFGQEGIIIQGPNDGILRKAWIGRAGILPRPLAESSVATSTVYPGAEVDGIVIDGANIEIGDVHTYAAWSGTAFRTRNTVRLTEGGRVIAESSRAQINISANTYGSAFFDIRSLSLLHPNWTGDIPYYTLPNASFDGATIAASAGFSCRITCKRTITQPARVVGSTAVVVTNDAQVDMYYSNSTAPSGDAEAGNLYSGIGLYSSSSQGGMLKVSGKNCNGDLVYLAGAGQTVIFNARTCTVGLRRVSPTNSLRGNNITGSVYRCTTGFVSTGQPASENIDLSMELLTGQVAFSGDAPSLDKAQNWNISASVNNVGYSTRQRLSANLDISTPGSKDISIPHKFLYKPDFRQIQLTIDDRATPTTSTVIAWVKDVTNTDVVVGYRVDTGDSNNERANLRVNVMIQ
ncbi:glycosyl hydrolase family 28-related protein [Escherichia coli]|uniref:glycosyl hydrolase family 28-related protein n=3 Tax=Escherichia coli TaxID=562 RepID=UPI0020233D91|nr:glycosyl hydrolase family 28-related protein [Escherichia coli]